MEGHANEHLVLFDCLVGFLVDQPSVFGDYHDGVRIWAEKHERDLIRHCLAEIEELATHASSFLPKPDIAELAEEFRRLPTGRLDTMADFRKKWQVQLRNVATTPNRRKFRWTGQGLMAFRRFCEAMAEYEGFRGISEDALQSLYEAYLAAWDADYTAGFAGFLDGIAERVNGKQGDDLDCRIRNVIAGERFPREKVRNAHAELERVQTSRTLAREGAS